MKAEYQRRDKDGKWQTQATIATDPVDITLPSGGHVLPAQWEPCAGVRMPAPEGDIFFDDDPEAWLTAYSAAGYTYARVVITEP